MSGDDLEVSKSMDVSSKFRECATQFSEMQDSFKTDYVDMVNQPNRLIYASLNHNSCSLHKIPVLKRNNVRMKSIEQVTEKIHKIITGGSQSLQVITDYDLTLTKQHVNGEATLSSFGLLSLYKHLPPDFPAVEKRNKEKYYPIELDLNLTNEEKTPHMIEWYRESEKLLTGITYKTEELRELIATNSPQLRDGTVELFKSLEKNKVPVLVLSAGQGNVLAEVLRYHGLCENDYFHIVSNFFKIENGTVTGYGCHENGLFIHPFNKNGLGCTAYFKKLGNKRHNVILMGDSLGDANMDQGVPEISTVLKIGFLYGKSNYIEESLPKYLNLFDIVLIDDQTMDVPREILSQLLTEQ